MSAGTIALRLVIGGDAKGAKAALQSLGTEGGRAGKALKAAQTGAAIGLAAIVGVVGKGVQSYETLTASVAGLQRQSKVGAEDASLLVGQWARYGVTAEAGGKGVMMLSKQIDAANIGTQTSIDSFARLGITLDDLKTMSPYQVLQQVRSTLSQMPPSAERTALSAKLLGRGFMSMSKWIAASSTDLDALNQQLKDSGQVMDEKELAKAKDDLKQMAFLQVDLRGFFVEIGRSAMPIIRDLVPGLKKLLAVVKPLAPHLVEIGGALAAFLVVTKVATGLSAMVTMLRTMKGLLAGGGLARGLGNVAGGGVRPTTGAPTGGPVATPGGSTKGDAGRGLIAGVVVTAGAVAIYDAYQKWGDAAAGASDSFTSAQATLDKNSRKLSATFVAQQQAAISRDAYKSPGVGGWIKSAGAGFLDTWVKPLLSGGEEAGKQVGKDYAAGVGSAGAGIALALRKSGDKAGAGLAAGLARGVGPALQSIQKVRNSAGRPIHMGNLDATQMLNEIDRVTGALGGMRGAARTAGNAAANAIRSPAGGGGSYRGHFMARGGYVRRTPGGTLLRVGEGKYDEVVAQVLPGKGVQQNAGGGETHFHFHVAQIIGTDERAARQLWNTVKPIAMSEMRLKGAMSRG